MIRRPPRSTRKESSAASDVYKRQALVRTWSNRDEEVVSDDIIKDSLRYADDKAYRSLRVPPLENVATYSKTELEAATTNNTQLQSSKTEIKVPFDLIEIIQIKELDSAGGTTRVFNEKLDVRTFNDPTAEKYLACLLYTSPSPRDRG